jgi:type IV pilus assembly protein PilE
MQKIRASLHTTRRHVAGFTLIELMIAVAIIGILVKLAYPAYTQSVLKSHRAEAKAALLDLASREERYFSTTNTFTTSAPALGYSSTATLTASAPLSVQAGNAIYYKLSVALDSTASAPNFTATATAVNNQVGDTKCKDFSLTQAGVQSVNGTDTAANCW